MYRLRSTYGTVRRGLGAETAVDLHPARKIIRSAAVSRFMEMGIGMVRKEGQVWVQRELAAI
jgi:hypothetical protein